MPGVTESFNTDGTDLWRNRRKGTLVSITSLGRVEVDVEGDHPLD